MRGNRKHFVSIFFLCYVNKILGQPSQICWKTEHLNCNHKLAIAYLRFVGIQNLPHIIQPLIQIKTYKFYLCHVISSTDASFMKLKEHVHVYELTKFKKKYTGSENKSCMGQKSVTIAIRTSYLVQLHHVTIKYFLNGTVG